MRLFNNVKLIEQEISSYFFNKIQLLEKKQKNGTKK